MTAITWFALTLTTHRTSVVSQYYEISVADEYVIRGSSGVLHCHIPEYIKPYVSVMSWIMNSEFEIVGHGMYGLTRTRLCVQCGSVPFKTILCLFWFIQLIFSRITLASN